MDITIEITKLFATISTSKISEIIKLPQSGSDRIYYRIFTQDATFIATQNCNVQENDTFIAFTNHFLGKGLPVPQILAVSEDRNIYIQKDAGTKSLLDVLAEKGYTEKVYNLFRKSLAELANLQIRGDDGLDYSVCLTAKEFGRQAIMSDLLYFKYYFLDTLKLPYDKQQLLNDFENIAGFLQQGSQYFMFRDFQSRNIIVNDDALCFIDYQGGMKGALQYDVASLLWQAKAELSSDWKNKLLVAYMDEADRLLSQKLDRTLFVSQYNGYVLLRLLQVLGAYGFRGLFERKTHFLTSIPLALRNLKTFMEEHPESVGNTAEFARVLRLIMSNDIISRFENIQADLNTPLVVTINSFSYKKGLPKDDSGHGGGFVFDCRGLLNPGCYDEYKCSSGLDRNVQIFLEEKTKMNEFLNSVYNLVDISVEDYIRRGFDHLSIAFGCTGGQHRSVYSAEQTARHLRNKFKVKIEVKHYNQDHWVKDFVSKEKKTEPKINRRKQRIHAGVKSLS